MKTSATTATNKNLKKSEQRFFLCFKIWQGLREMLSKMAFLLFIGMEGQLGEYYFHEYNNASTVAAVSLTC